ncbi:unnamed protein product [Adineta ricciae]|uniref:glutathione-specific gamma-glutamylcyclotransferase n=1 Tax=Adineta ricciae TaxID=249248 RepID=A0A814EFD7_ADIRI|nr:unnamed protein product [Adineta ricciae]CAF1603995.1 unnamed protein product [Adineta ricciae]
MVDIVQLDESLQLLNGLDESKRNIIVESIQRNNQISVFAYGSLLWNPIKYAEMEQNCILQGYKKGFFCEDFFYRGTFERKGLTLGLKEKSDSYVHGALLIAKDDKILDFLKAFAERETPATQDGRVMDIYKYDFIEVTRSGDGTPVYALTCIVNEESEFCVDIPETIKGQVSKMSQAEGRNGTNFEYLFSLAAKYKELNIKDTFTPTLDELCEKARLYQLPL